MSKGKKILVLTYWSYNDALIQAYTLPYVKIIANVLPDDSKIFLFTLDKEKSANPNISDKIQNISARYYPFGIRALIHWCFNFIRLFYLIKKNRITHIHCWCTPAGAAGYILSKLTGANLVLDSYEPHAEAMVENGEWSKSKFSFKLLFWLEKKQSKRASFVIAAASGMQFYAKEKYGLTISNFFVKPACVNLEKFSHLNIKNKSLLVDLKFENKIVCVYAGKFGGIYLKNEVFEFYKVAYEFWKDKLRILILTNQNEIELLQLAKKYDIPASILTIKFVEHSQIPNYIGLGDFAICPVKPVPTKRFCTPIKNGEYWALGLPIIIPNKISDDSDIIEKSGNGFVWNELNSEEYLKSVKYIDKYLRSKSSEGIYQENRLLAEKHRNFNICSDIYRNIYK